MQQKSFENTLNEKVNDFELEPRSGLWQAIEVELKPAKKRLMPLWWGAPLLVAITLALLFVVNENASPSTEKVVHSNTQMEDIANRQLVASDLPMDANTSDIKSMRKPDASVLTPMVANNASRSKSYFAMPSPPPTFNLVKYDLHKVIEGKPIICGLTSSSTFATIDTTKLTLETLINPKDSLPEDTPVVIDNGIREKAPQPIWHAFVGINFQPTQSKSMLTENPNYAISPSNLGSDFSYRKTTDEPIHLLSASAILGWQTKRHQYYTGLGFQQFGYKQNVKNIERVVSTGFPVTTANIRLYPTDSFLSAAYTSEGEYVKNKFTYLSIPLGYQFQFIQQRKWQVAVNAEASIGLLLKSRALFYDETTGYYVKQNALPFNPTKKMDAFFSTGIAVRYLLSDQWAVFVQPSVGVSMRPLQLGAVNTRYQFLKWGFGLQYRLY